MTAYGIENPYPIFNNVLGLPITGGRIYIGVPGMDPEVNPQPVYWDSASTIPASQPLMMKGGYVVRAGTPARPYTGDDYSIRVYDFLGAVVLYEPSVKGELVAFIERLASDAGSALIGFSQAVTYPDGSVGAKLQQTIDPTDRPYLAKGDGVTDDQAAFAEADNAAFARGVPLHISKNHLIGSNYTVKSAVQWGGGKIIAASGATISFSASLDALAVQIFDGSGTFDLTNSKIDKCFAEWWGAKGDGVTDDSAAVMKALPSGAPMVQLLPKTYLVPPNTVKVGAYQFLNGLGEFWTDGYGSRILCNSATGVIVQVGGDSFPGTINAMPFACRMRHVYVSRNQAPLITDDCTGILVQYGVHMSVERCGSNESYIAIRDRGVVDTFISGCYAKRDSPAASGSDAYRGFLSDGSANISAAGGNASLNSDFERNRSELTVPIADSIALEVTAMFTDQWWKIESSGPHSIGVQATGDAATAGAGALTNTDFNLSGCRIDQTVVWSYVLQQINQSGSIEMDCCYAGPSSGGVLHVVNCGTIKINGGQWRAQATTQGAVSINGANQFFMSGTAIFDGIGDIITLVSVQYSELSPSITNYGRNSGGAAIKLASSNSRNVIRPRVRGGSSGTFAYGIKVDDITTTKCELNVTGIDNASVAIPLQVAGVPITAPAIDAQGNVYAGAF